MKVGILTYQRTNNYGGCLQAYALQHEIIQNGYDCEIIDYRGEWLKNSPIKKNGFKARALDFCIYTGNQVLKRMTQPAYQRFRDQHFKLSGCVRNEQISKLSDRYDLFISGSDQVWNYNICGNLGLYLQEFVQEKACRGSYAASFGITQIAEKHKERYAQALKQFDFLGVREPEGADIIRELTGLEATVVLDPTLLLTDKEWLQVEEPMHIKQPYIFVYQLGPSARLLRFVQELSRRKGMECVFCPFPVGVPQKGKYCPFISPSKWLYLMHHAAYVVTNSFHGTAFSINFEKQFFVDISDNLSTLSSRIVRMLALTGLEDRMINVGKENLMDQMIQFASVRDRLEEQRALSKAFLLNMLHQCGSKGGQT